VSYGRASLGANRKGGLTTFEVWAPATSQVEVILESGLAPSRVVPMKRMEDGYFRVSLREAEPGTLYRFRLDGRGPFPDPASRFQPLGVHGPSQVVDPLAFPWTDGAWRGLGLGPLLLYELHVGSFTPAGTFRGVLERLPYLHDLGVTAIELMPVADFPGLRNWGYDGVALFAPARCYGTPDEFRALVDAAHRLGLGVHLDVVYNHFGPDGAYQGAFSPDYSSRTHRTPWGETLNFDGPGNGPVRAYVVENALRWVREYHLDGLRLDATHAIVDASPRPIVAEITTAIQEAVAPSQRQVLVIAEDVRNLRRIVEPAADGGWGADAVWSDDFHHQVRRALAGDRDGYFADFEGSTAQIAETIRLGWFYHGQYAPYFGSSRGTDPRGIPAERFVFFLQNHDQVGNRAFGDRLHHAIDLAAWRAASTLLMLLPETPLLFMGQEWGASTPFLYFTDHHGDLGRSVTAGRRQEFSWFAAFAENASRAPIPDPQDPATFDASRLRWEEQAREPHQSLLQLNRYLLQLRRTEPALRWPERAGDPAVVAWGDDVILLRRDAPGARPILAAIRLRGSGAVDLGEHPLARLAGEGPWTRLMTTEDRPFASEAAPLEVDGTVPSIHFTRPGAALLTAGRAPG